MFMFPNLSACAALLPELQHHHSALRNRDRVGSIENAEVFVPACRRSKKSGGIHQIGERNAAEAHAETIEKAAAGKSSGGKWASADVVVQIQGFKYTLLVTCSNGDLTEDRSEPVLKITMNW